MNDVVEDDDDEAPEEFASLQGSMLGTMRMESFLEVPMSPADAKKKQLKKKKKKKKRKKDIEENEGENSNSKGKLQLNSPVRPIKVTTPVPGSHKVRQMFPSIQIQNSQLLQVLKKND